MGLHKPHGPFGRMHLLGRGGAARAREPFGRRRLSYSDASAQPVRPAGAVGPGAGGFCTQKRPTAGYNETPGTPRRSEGESTMSRPGGRPWNQKAEGSKQKAAGVAILLTAFCLL